MKTKRIIFALCTVLVLAAVISVSVFAGMFAGGASWGNAKETQTDTETETVQTEAKESAITLHGTLVGPDDYYASNSFVNENAEPEKVYVIGDESIPLKLEGSIILESGNYIDVYNDAEGNVYSFDESGEFSSYDMNDDIYIEKIHYSVGDHKEFGKDYIPPTELAEEDAIEIAKETARKYFGEKFDPFELESTLYDEDTGGYHVYFEQYFGDEKYIRGMWCVVGIMGDQTISCCGMTNYYDLKDFDTSLLDGITKDALYSDLENKVCEMHGDNLVSYEIDSIKLKVKNGTYYLEASVGAEINYQFRPDEKAKTIFDGGHLYRYTLPQN